MAVLDKRVALNYLDTSFVGIMGLVRALRQCSNGLGQIMHEPEGKCIILLLLHHPRALKPCNAHKTGI